MYVKNFEDLLVWQKAHKLVLLIYKGDVLKMPPEEKYGLESQLKRAVVSVPANIAEGCRRQHTKETAQFLGIALGSLSEARYYFILCKELGYINGENYENLIALCVEIDKMLDSLQMKIRKQIRP